MTSSSPLPFELINVLTPFRESFQATATRFGSRISGEPGGADFVRICELQNTLDMLSVSKRPLSLLWQLRGGGDKTTPDSKQDAEDLLSFVLNAEFALYYLYHQFDLLLSPSLAHWVAVVRGSESYLNNCKDISKWTLRDRVIRIRSSFVKGILGNHGPKLAVISPEDFALQDLDFIVNPDQFREALHEQGIGDSDVDDQIKATTPEPDNFEDAPPAASPVGSTGTQNGQQNGHRSVSQASGRTRADSSLESPATDGYTGEMESRIVSILSQAMTEELTRELTQRIITYMDAHRERLASYPLELLRSTAIARLFSSNPKLTQDLITLFLQDGTKVQRRELTSSLEFVPISLKWLELLNDLLIKNHALLSLDEKSHLIHGVLENGIRAAEAIGASSALGETYEVAARGVPAGRQAQQRHISLLCLFIQSLLRNKVVGVPDVYYQIADMGVKFTFVKEARDLWSTYYANAT